MRDDFTWLAYVMLAYFAYLQAMLGPVMPFLRQKLHLSYTLGGLHISAFALGALLSGLFGDRVVRRLGRRATFWGGGAGMGLGGLLMAFGPHVAATLAGVLVAGLLGTLLLIVIQAALSDHHGVWRSSALLEANVGASLAAMLASLAVGGFARAGIGWEAALVAGGLTWVVIFLARRGVPVPDARYAIGRSGASSRALPALFWAYWVAIALGVSVEACMAFWGAQFMERAAGLATANASAVMSFFFGSMVIGRLAGAYLSRIVRSTTLLQAAVGIALAGFPIFWLAPSAPLNIAGLVIVGLGIANYYPLAMSIATGVAPEQSDTASARVIMGVGLASLIVPQTLGWLADQVEIRNAYGLVIVLLATAAGVIVVANRLAAGRSEMVRVAPVAGSNEP